MARCLEPPLKLRVEDAAGCIEQRVSIVRFAVVDLVADLNVLGPVPNHVSKEGLVPSECEGVIGTLERRVHAVA